MKAIVCDKYGFDNLRLEEVKNPTPGDNEVLVEIHASSVNTNNILLTEGKPFFVRLMAGGILKPKTGIPGSDIAGRITAVGKNVKQFKPGDEVFGEVSEYGGALAAYAAVPENAIVPKPVNLSFDEAAAVPQASIVALQAIRDKGQIKAGQKVLIYGASGGIGSFAVQIAKYFGAEVTGVCSTKNLDMLRSIGADHVIDYTKEDFTKNGQHYDLIFAIAFRSVFDHKRALSPQGIFVSTGGPSISRIFQEMLIGPMISKKGGKKVVTGWSASVTQRDLTFIKELTEAGKVKPVIDRIYPLNETAEAFRYYAKGHTSGKVIITISHSS